MKENQQSLRVWLARPLFIGLGLGYVKMLPTFEPQGIVILFGVLISIPCAIDPFNRGGWLITLFAALTYGGLALLLRFAL